MTYYLAISTALYLLLGIIVFGFRKTGYSHLKDTISELGEQGARDQKLVNYLLFLPIGIALFVIGYLTEDFIAKGLASVIATGYTIAAFFPCDKGAPIEGSWKQNIHNLGGFIQYAGGIYFINEAALPVFNIDHSYIMTILIAGIVLLSIPSLILRGLAQRTVEIVLFIYLSVMIY